MSKNYSAFSLLREGLRQHRGWQPAWRSPKPKSSDDVVIIGGGGHGLATNQYKKPCCPDLYKWCQY